VHGLLRLTSTLGAVAISAAGVTACGGSSDQSVAEVAGVGAITKATLEHWMPIEARLLYQEVPTRPAPNGVVPDPPTYTACVAYLQTTRQRVAEVRPRPTTAQLREKCAQREQELKVLTLNTLIGWEWIIGKGLEVGMRVTDAEVAQHLEAVRHGDLAYVSFDKYLKYSGQTMADMLFRAKVQLFEVKAQEELMALARKLPKGLSPRQQQVALTRLAASFPTEKQWVARTDCRPGYVTSSCKQYTGPLAPGIPN
jgi:foldase protein PrsA